MMDSHKEPDDENQEDKEHDKEFKEMYKVWRRGVSSVELELDNPQTSYEHQA